MRVMGSCLACHGKRDRGTLDRGFQQRVFHRRCEPNGGIGGSIWLGSGWNSNPRSRCTVDGGGVDLGSSSGSGVDFWAGLPAGHRIGWGVDEGVSRAVISFVVTHRSMLSGYWGYGAKCKGHFRGRCRVVIQGLLKAPFTTITRTYITHR